MALVPSAPAFRRPSPRPKRRESVASSSLPARFGGSAVYVLIARHEPDGKGPELGEVSVAGRKKVSVGRATGRRGQRAKVSVAGAHPGNYCSRDRSLSFPGTGATPITTDSTL